MRLESKIINALFEQEFKTETAPPIGIPIDVPSNGPPKNFSFRELKKNARDMMTLNHSNLNALFKEQNRDTCVEDAKFMEFYFGSCELVGVFKVIYADNGQFPPESPRDGTVCVCWNGNKLRVL